MAKGLPVNVYADPRYLQNSVKGAIRNLPPVSINAHLNFGGINKFGAPLGKITAQADEFSKSMEAANARVVAFSSSAAVIASISIAVKALAENTVLLEKRLADLNIVFEKSQTTINSFGRDLFKVAKETGESFENVFKISTEFARAGSNISQTLEKTKSALAVTRLTGVSTADAVKGLTAAMEAYGEEVINTTNIVDKFSAVDTKFAVSTADFVQAFQRSASTAKQAGVNFDELTAIITSLQQTTQRGGAVIGNSIKSIFATLKTDSNLLERLQKDYKINVKLEDGSLRSSLDILTDVAEKIKDVKNTSEKADLVKTIAGGKYQFNIVASLLADLAKGSESIVSKSLDASAAAFGSTEAKLNELNKTLDATINKTVLSAQEFAGLFGNLAFAEDAKAVFNGVNNAIEALNDNLDPTNLSVTGRVLKGIAEGIGNIVSGPVLAGGVILFGTLFAKFTKFAVESAATFINANKSLNETKHLEQSVLMALSRNGALQSQILSLQGDQLSQRKLILSTYEAEYRYQQLISQTSRVLAPTLYKGGFRTSETGLTKTSAGGFLPALNSESSAIKRGVGGASSSDKPVVIPNFNFGGGKKGTMIANTSEYIVPNFANGGTAVFNKSMVSKYGLPAGAQKINAASGFIPNYAAERSDEEVNAILNQYGLKGTELVKPRNVTSIANLIKYGSVASSLKESYFDEAGYSPAKAKALKEVFSKFRTIQSVGAKKDAVSKASSSNGDLVNRFAMIYGTSPNGNAQSTVTIPYDGKKFTFTKGGPRKEAATGILNSFSNDVNSSFSEAFGSLFKTFNVYGDGDEKDARKHIESSVEQYTKGIVGEMFDASVRGGIFNKYGKDSGVIDFPGSKYTLSKLSKAFNIPSVIGGVEAKYTDNPLAEKSSLEKFLKADGIKKAADGYIPNYAHSLGVNSDSVSIRSVTSPFGKDGNRMRGTGAVHAAILDAVRLASEKGKPYVSADIISESSQNAFAKYFGRASRGKNKWAIGDFKNAAEGFSPKSFKASDARFELFKDDIDDIEYIISLIDKTAVGALSFKSNKALGQTKLKFNNNFTSEGRGNRSVMEGIEAYLLDKGYDTDFKNLRVKGLGFAQFDKLADVSKERGINEIVSPLILAQTPDKASLTGDRSKDLFKYFPQLAPRLAQRYKTNLKYNLRDNDKKSIVHKGSLEDFIKAAVGSDKVDFNRISLSSLSTKFAAGGFLPAQTPASSVYGKGYSDLDNAINRERQSGLSMGQIKVNTDQRLKNLSNPFGLAVTNLRDEPDGKIPNFAQRDEVPAAMKALEKVFKEFAVKLSEVEKKDPRILEKLKAELGTTAASSERYLSDPKFQGLLKKAFGDQAFNVAKNLQNVVFASSSGQKVGDIKFGAANAFGKESLEGSRTYAQNKMSVEDKILEDRIDAERLAKIEETSRKRSIAGKKGLKASQESVRKAELAAIQLNPEPEKLRTLYDPIDELARENKDLIARAARSGVKPQGKISQDKTGALKFEDPSDQSLLAPFEVGGEKYRAILTGVDLIAESTEKMLREVAKELEKAGDRLEGSVYIDDVGKATFSNKDDEAKVGAIEARIRSEKVLAEKDKAEKERQSRIVFSKSNLEEQAKQISLSNFLKSKGGSRVAELERLSGGGYEARDSKGRVIKSFDRNFENFQKEEEAARKKALRDSKRDELFSKTLYSPEKAKYEARIARKQVEDLALKGFAEEKKGILKGSITYNDKGNAQFSNKDDKKAFQDYLKVNEERIKAEQKGVKSSSDVYTKLFLMQTALAGVTGLLGQFGPEIEKFGGFVATATTNIYGLTQLAEVGGLGKEQFKSFGNKASEAAAKFLESDLATKRLPTLTAPFRNGGALASVGSTAGKLTAGFARMLPVLGQAALAYSVVNEGLKLFGINLNYTIGTALGLVKTPAEEVSDSLKLFGKSIDAVTAQNQSLSLQDVFSRLAAQATREAKILKIRELGGDSDEANAKIKKITETDDQEINALKKNEAFDEVSFRLAVAKKSLAPNSKNVLQARLDNLEYEAISGSSNLESYESNFDKAIYRRAFINFDKEEQAKRIKSTTESTQIAKLFLNSKIGNTKESDFLFANNDFAGGAELKAANIAKILQKNELGNLVSTTLSNKDASAQSKEAATKIAQFFGNQPKIDSLEVFSTIPQGQREAVFKALSILQKPKDIEESLREYVNELEEMDKSLSYIDNQIRGLNTEEFTKEITALTSGSGSYFKTFSSSLKKKTLELKRDFISSNVKGFSQLGKDVEEKLFDINGGNVQDIINSLSEGSRSQLENNGENLIAKIREFRAKLKEFSIEEPTRLIQELTRETGITLLDTRTGAANKKSEISASRFERQASLIKEDFSNNPLSDSIGSIAKKIFEKENQAFQERISDKLGNLAVDRSAVQERLAIGAYANPEDRNVDESLLEKFTAQIDQLQTLGAPQLEEIIYNLSDVSEDYSKSLKERVTQLNRQIKIDEDVRQNSSQFAISLARQQISVAKTQRDLESSPDYFLGGFDRLKNSKEFSGAFEANRDAELLKARQEEIRANLAFSSVYNDTNSTQREKDDAVLKIREESERIAAIRRDAKDRTQFEARVLQNLPTVQKNFVEQDAARLSDKRQKIGGSAGFSFSDGTESYIAQVRQAEIDFEYTMGQKIPESFAAGMATAFDKILTQADTLGGALRSMALEFLSTVRQAFLQQAASSIVSSLSSGVLQKADGGYISSGSGTKDDVPALLMRGEYVLNKNAVNKYGVNFLERMNQGGIQKFSTGGYAMPSLDSGAGPIVGRQNLYGFATQQYTSGANDKIMNSANSTEMLLEDESRKLSFGALSGRYGSVRTGEVAAAKEQAVQLYRQDVEAEAMRKAEEKKANKALVRSLAITAASGAFLYGVGGMKAAPSSSGNANPYGSNFSSFYNSGLSDTSRGNYTFSGGTRAYNSGGPVLRGSRIRDEAPAMLTSGEYVINNRAVDKYGRGMIDKINSLTYSKLNSGTPPEMERKNSSQSVGDVNINISLSIENNEVKSEASDSSNNKRKEDEELAAKIKNAVKEVIAQEKRLGGVLRK